MPSGSFLSHSQLPLSPVLALALHQGVLSDLSPTTIEPCLLKNLDWRITDAQGNDITTAKMAKKLKLKITVVSRKMVPLLDGEDDLFPQYGGWSEHPNLTAGKIGGLGYE